MTLTIGRTVWVLRLSTWVRATVTDLSGRYGITATLDKGEQMHIHPSVYGRAVRVSEPRRKR